MSKVVGSSNIGMIRKENQDAFLLDTLNKSDSFAVVCDGMGGSKGGKTASTTAARIFFEYIIDKYNVHESVKDLLNQAIDRANKIIYEQSIHDKNLAGMGTTLVSVLVREKTAHFVNIGDSRAYIISKTFIKRITHDHSAVQELVDIGRITEDQARIHPNKNIITKALGVCENETADYFVQDIGDDDIILLCSDGLTNFVEDIEIQHEVLRTENFEDIPQILIKLANERGGSDNITVIAIKA